MEATPDTPALGFVDRDAERAELRELLARGRDSYEQLADACGIGSDEGNAVERDRSGSVTTCLRTNPPDSRQRRPAPPSALA
jgi:hypothetical protein